VTFDPIEAKGNRFAPPNNEVLNSQNEIPITFCIMEDALGFGLLDAVTDDSLLHINRIDRMFMVPRNSLPRTVRPAANPPSSDSYEVISDCIPSSGPPPRRRIVSYFFARNHQWYPTPNITEPSVVIIRSTGSLKSNGDGVDSAGMSPINFWMCLGKERN
jgi:hypothetical protein